MQILHLFCLNRTSFFVWNILSISNTCAERQQPVANKLKPLEDTVIFRKLKLGSERRLFLVVLRIFFHFVFKSVNLNIFFPWLLYDTFHLEQNSNKVLIYTSHLSQSIYEQYVPILIIPSKIVK